MGAGVAAGVATGVAAFGGGIQSGGRFRQWLFDKKHPEDVIHANNMFELVKQIDGEITKLSSAKPENIERLAVSSRIEEVKNAYPSIATAFNNRAAALQKEQETAAKRAAFMQKNANKPPKPE